MAKHPLAMALAKVIIAAAWADGELSLDEINDLKRLLAELGQTSGNLALTAEEWAELEIYLHSPVEAAERARLIADLRDLIVTPSDRQIAINAIDRLLAADRVMTPAERAVAQEIHAALDHDNHSLLHQIGRAFRLALGIRARGPNREDLLPEFLRNRIYYALHMRLGKHIDELGVDQHEVYALALAGGLLARVARVDAEVTPAEHDQIVAILQEWWHLDHARATLVAEVALAESAASLDFFRLAKEFAESTTVEQRERFLDALFAVAIADGELSGAESAEISRITAAINLPHDRFVAARMRLPRQPGKRL
ncbi:TerB family tellurite resistance protein [Chloroflexus sp.]|uniref:tellurite resistance TerB family protein n=1 Tax=Chloroflexus sp. TaxID=1904827 RepID=UPI00298F35CC|nr:TerB family tellurite resistance protein [Chloroflexus sp.]MCS6887204.1 TerB family tellurite resistance protein [Chloroflexus sp.]MDW8404839.1 TerB family tellurite resistance protein [Chloroflexus sp.]